MATTIKTTYPEIKALVYFDAYASANFGGMYDFRVDTSASSYRRSARWRTTRTSTRRDVRRRHASERSVATSRHGLRLAGRSQLDRLDRRLSVMGYDVYRDGSMVGTVASSGFTDPPVVRDARIRTRSEPGTERVTLRASAAQSAWRFRCRPRAFADGFESGSMGAWTNVVRVSAENAGIGSASDGIVRSRVGRDRWRSLVCE